MDDIPPDDGLKWFGEGFDGFPKRLPDDCVEYLIYIIDEELNGNVAATRRRLNEVLQAANESAKKLLKDYIWQQDAFQLKLRPDLSTQDIAKSDIPIPGDGNRTPHLQGRTKFGDSIADEWLIVYLLLELSKQCRDAWIRVFDTDGEFLLIEAANALPRWLNPDIAENRVWINNGHLRIIPLDQEPSSRNLSVAEALAFARRASDRLIILPFIEDEAFYRLREYPRAIATTFHNALITIPRNLAYILHCSPAYISPAVEAFYLRDPISWKPLATKDISTLQFAPEDLVTVSVKFTKIGYAQLRSQLFDTPPSWTGIIPRLADPKVEIGMKLTCGFEMMLSDPQNRDRRAVREIGILLQDIESGDEVLPADSEIQEWPNPQDDEKWLDIDYNDFENELSGIKGRSQAGNGKGKGFGDRGAQENLRKMVSRFEDFLNDEAAGAEGVAHKESLEDSESDEGSDSGTDPGGGDDSSYDEAEFKKAMEEMTGMSPGFVSKSGLLDEARKLALEDAEEQSELDEDEEMKKVMELMEKELKTHGALNLDAKGSKVTPTSDQRKQGKKPVVFGPEPPPGMKKDTLREVGDLDDSELGLGDEELSSDEEEFNDVNLGLAKNMLEAFKGQAGLSGPAGNLMRAMGVTMPRDEAPTVEED